MTDQTTRPDASPDPADVPRDASAPHALDEPLTAPVWEVDEPVDGDTTDGGALVATVADPADEPVPGDEPGDEAADEPGDELPKPGDEALEPDDEALEPDGHVAQLDGHVAQLEADVVGAPDDVATDGGDDDPAPEDPSGDGADSAAGSPETAVAEDVDTADDALDGTAATVVEQPPDHASQGAVPDAEPSSDPAQADARDAPGGWTALGRALRPRLTKAQLLAGALCAVLGFALVVQVRQNGDTSLEGMRQADLVRMLDETTDRGDALARQESNLAAERDELLSGSDRRTAALDALRRTATTQGILTGRLPAQGPGVVVTMTEPDGAIKPLTMLDVLEELRNAGAEAIQLNDRRVTASSAFTGAPGAVVLDGATLSAPFTWIAIGDPDTIATALQIPGGAMAAVRNDGGSGTIQRQDAVTVDAVRIVPDPVYATPVPVPTS